MDDALEQLALLAAQLSEDETSLKVKCLLKVTVHTFRQYFGMCQPSRSLNLHFGGIMLGDASKCPPPVSLSVLVVRAELLWSAHITGA